MGNQEINPFSATEDSLNLTRAIITDLLALDQMMKESLFEKGVRRIGAEQELAIINSEYRPSTSGQKFFLASMIHVSQLSLLASIWKSISHLA